MQRLDMEQAAEVAASVDLAVLTDLGCSGGDVSEAAGEADEPVIESPEFRAPASTVAIGTQIRADAATSTDIVAIIE